jgi:hypothetical protein
MKKMERIIFAKCAKRPLYIQLNSKIIIPKLIHKRSYFTMISTLKKLYQENHKNSSR